MGVTKETIKAGNGVDQPKKGDDVTIQYTGNLYDESKGQAAHFRGKQYVHPTKLLLWIQTISVHKADQLSHLDRFDTSRGRGEFKTRIGVGQVIKGKSFDAC